jgi:hypothetical protein
VGEKHHAGGPLNFENLFGMVAGVYLDEPITTQTTAGGRPVSFTARGGALHRVDRLLGTWQAPGEARLYRLQVTSPAGPAVAEVVAPPGGGSAWRLRRIWT